MPSHFDMDLSLQRVLAEVRRDGRRELEIYGRSMSIAYDMGRRAWVLHDVESDRRMLLSEEALMSSVTPSAIVLEAGKKLIHEADYSLWASAVTPSLLEQNEDKFKRPEPKMILD